MEGKDIVLFLTKSRLYLFAGDGVIALDFPPNVVSDLDLRDRDALLNLVAGFIDGNKIAPAQIFMVLADSICFSKDFPVKDPENTEKEDAGVQEFIDAVPFNYVLSKVYKTPTTFRAVAANQDLADAIADAFTAKGFGLTALVPANIYPRFGASEELTPEFAKAVLSDRPATLSASMIGEKTSASHELSTTKTAKQPISTRLMVLIGVFGLLILVFVVLLLARR